MSPQKRAVLVLSTLFFLIVWFFVAIFMTTRIKKINDAYQNLGTRENYQEALEKGEK